MTELSSEAKKLLAQLSTVDDPTPAERSSGDAAVRRMLAAQGMRNMPPLAPQPVPSPLAARSGAAVKLAWVVGAAFVVTLGMFGLWRASEPARQAQLHVPAAQPTPQSEAAADTVTAAVPAPRPTIDTVAAQTTVPQRKHDKAAYDSLAQELRFVSSVDAEIRAGAYDRALRRLQQHKGSPALQEERAAMRVLALCGRNADTHAKREREQFLRASPSSVLAARVRAACAGAPSP
jgi:hypothetical protein